MIFHYVLQAGTWFNAEGEQRLKDSYATDGTLEGSEKALQLFDLCLTQAKVSTKSQQNRPDLAATFLPQRSEQDHYLD